MATGSLLDNFEWLKQHGDEALEASSADLAVVGCTMVWSVQC